jgi:hypothetical protein
MYLKASIYHCLIRKKKARTRVRPFLMSHVAQTTNPNPSANANTNKVGGHNVLDPDLGARNVLARVFKLHDDPPDVVEDLLAVLLWRRGERHVHAKRPVPVFAQTKDVVENRQQRGNEAGSGVGGGALNCIASHDMPWHGIASSQPTTTGMQMDGGGCPPRTGGALEGLPLQSWRSSRRTARRASRCTRAGTPT